MFSEGRAGLVVATLAYSIAAAHHEKRAFRCGDERGQKPSQPI